MKEKLNFAIVEITLKCSKCAKPLFINGPVRRVYCKNCQSEIDIPVSLWRTILSDIQWVLNESKLGEGEKSEYISPVGSELNWLSGNLKPYCMNCKTDFPDILDHPERNGWIISCKKCRKTTTIMHPPDWLVEIFPDVVLVLNAEIREPDGKPEKPAIEPVLFKCPSCGGNLKVDGSHRVIKCQFCGSNLYLPDDLWLRFYPAKKIRRWMIGF